MIHAFLLVLILGEREQNNPMYFYDINRCNYFASQIVKRYGNYNYMSKVPNEHKATAYCKPVYVDPQKTKIYD